MKSIVYKKRTGKAISIKNISKNEYLSQLFSNTIFNKNINTVFQPIISLRDGSVYGYEALSRGPKNTPMESPVALFQYAEAHGKLWELEFLCRTTALETVSKLESEINLFLNVNPNILDDIKFKRGFTKDYLNKYSVNSKKIVFEITEREAIKNISGFINTVQNYKNQDYKIAIDDAGAGYSGLNLISDINPHFIKLDMKLVRDVDKNITKQSLIKSMREFASLTNTYLIAEGIETENELIKLIDIGIHYGQGYFIQKPNANILPIKNEVFDIIKKANTKKNHFFGERISDIYISNISRKFGTITPNILVSQVHDMLEKNGTIPGFCITEDGVVLGVITNKGLYKYISGLYGYTLFSNKPITRIMSKDFLSVDYKTTIDVVAKNAMNRDYDKIYDFITITKDNKYYGIVTVKDLLEKLIEIEVINAKHLNPLSELPGNILIEKQIEKCISEDGNYYILYFDLDNFKAYNDVYGFENGDRVLKRVANILKEITPKDNFVGHIGGDDFIVILSSCCPEELSLMVIDKFDKSLSDFYNQSDMDKGFIITKNRHGIEESYPLLSISIAGVESYKYKSIYDLTESIGEIKKRCKEMAGSNYILAK